jgi:hypothetical protein
MRLPLALGKKTDKAPAPAESIERLLNAYLEAVPDGKEPTPIYGTGGLRPWASGLPGAIRGAIKLSGVPYLVAGESLVSLDENGAATIRGAVPGSDLVSMASDGVHVVAVAEGEIYVWNGSFVAPVTDPDAPAASGVDYVDGFFIFSERDTDQWFICELGDPTAYDALDFATAEWKPDKLRTPIVIRRTVFLAGEESIEAQQNVGAADFPFQRVEDVFIDVGLAGRDAWARSNDTLYWIGHDFTVRRLDGVTATPIHNGYIARILKGWSDPTATVGSAHVVGRHLFIVFRNPDGCIVYDQATDRWHERASYDSATWRVRHYVEAYGKQLFCSASEGKVYELANDAYDEDGEILEFEVVTPWAYAGNQRFSVTELNVVAQTGVGSHTLDAQITCDRTIDGLNWRGRKSSSLGRAGVRERMVRFGPQGQARAMAFRFRITDPVQRALLGAYAEVDPER